MDKIDLLEIDLTREVERRLELEGQLEQLDENSGTNSTENETFFEVGKDYQIRTVTMIYTGKVKEIRKLQVLLEQACWIPQTLKWHESCAKGEYEEVEPYTKDVAVSLGGIMDFTEIPKLPSEVK